MDRRREERNIGICCWKNSDRRETALLALPLKCDIESAATSSQPSVVDCSSHGSKRKACSLPSASNPLPAISPRSLIVSGSVKRRELPPEISVFKSTIRPASHKKACAESKSPPGGIETPTT